MLLFNTFIQVSQMLFGVALAARHLGLALAARHLGLALAARHLGLALAARTPALFRPCIISCPAFRPCISCLANRTY
jgi:hypothetical protein